jgi:hypothetical protein
VKIVVAGMAWLGAVRTTDEDTNKCGGFGGI